MLRVRQPAIKSQAVFNTYFRIPAATLDEGLMSYPRNVASPEPLVIGPIVQISDGAVQTAGVSVKVSKDSGAFAAGAGSLSIEEGEWSYLPTQGETDCESLRIILYKTGCYSRSKQVVFSASDLFGYAGTDQSKITNATATVNLSNTTIKTATDIETDTQNIQNRLPAALVDGRMVALAQSVTDKTGYTLTQAFPANFGNLGIDPSGSILSVLLVEELAETALTANGAIDAIPPAVWNALTTETYVDGSFGDRSLISTNSIRSVAVTGSGHVAAVLHDAEPDSIPEDAFVTGAMSARALAADAATEIATAVGTLQVLTRLDSMIESDGAGQFRFDTIALEMAPAGGGGGGTDWTANERTAIRAILGVPTSGTTPTDPTTGILDEIRDKTALITSGNVQTSIPVTAQGQINGPLYIGDDYLTANGRAFDWTIALPTGFVAGTSTCKFGMIYEDETGVSEFNVSGSVTDVGGGNVRLRFELPRATTGTLKAGFHRWSVEIVSASGVEVTPVAYNDRKLVEWREKQT